METRIDVIRATPDGTIVRMSTRPPARLPAAASAKPATAARIACARFNGLSRVARHRLVYDALRNLIPRGIHALAIDGTLTGIPTATGVPIAGDSIV